VFNGATATIYYPRELFQGEAITVDEPQFYAEGASTLSDSSQSRLSCGTRGSSWKRLSGTPLGPSGREDRVLIAEHPLASSI